MDRKILIVEDERLVAEDIKITLEGLGYCVQGISCTARGAIRMAEKEQPDLVLMDIMLRGQMDGIDAAYQISSKFSIPVIYLTAYGDEGMIERAKLSVPYGYIIKPFTERELHSNIEMALYRNEMEKRIAHLNAVLRAIRGVNQLITREKDRDKLLTTACDKLIETRGYFDSWICLRGEEGECEALYGAGLGSYLEPLAELLRCGEMPRCGREAVECDVAVVTSNPSGNCRYCPLWEKHSGRGVLTQRLEARGNVYGVLSVSLPKELADSGEERSVFNEVAGDVAFALYNMELEKLRYRAEKNLFRVNRALAAISQCNQVLIHATDEVELLEAICDIIAGAGGYIFSFVGFLERDGMKRVRPVSRAGTDDGFLDAVVMEWSDGDDVKTPPSRACVRGRAVIVRDYSLETWSECWSREAMQRNFRSSVSLPLRGGSGDTFGVLTIFSTETGSFGDDEVRLLTEMSEELSFGIVTIRERQRHSATVEALRKSEESYRDLFENANDLIQSVSPEGRFQYVNRAWRERLGYSEKEVKDKTMMDIIHPGSLDHCMDLFRRIMAGENISKIEADFRTKDGRKITVEGSANCRMENGRPVSTRGIFRDITGRKRAEKKLRKAYEELKRTQAQLVQSEKLAGMGTMAAGIAHEINNPLQVIMGMTEMMEDVDDKEDIKKGCMSILDAADRISEIVRSLSAYSRDARTADMRPVELGQIIKNSLQMAKFSVKMYDIDIQLDLARGPAIRANPGEIQQIFINLITNAVDAMEGRGELILRTRSGENGIEVRVADTGSGICEEDVGNIFDPFFTTKKVGKGTGLGLHVVHQIMTKYGGDVRVESEVGKGTVFTLEFPQMHES